MSYTPSLELQPTTFPLSLSIKLPPFDGTQRFAFIDQVALRPSYMEGELDVANCSRCWVRV
jgi:hypothetical protein